MTSRATKRNEVNVLMLTVHVMFEAQGGNCHEIAHYMIMMNCTLNVTCVPVK